jgi:hypothetical protein
MSGINLKFVDVPVRSADPIVRAREALNLRLAEQIARAKDPRLTRERRKGKGSERTTHQVPVSPWFIQRVDGTVILTIKAGGKKCTAIEIPSMDEFESHVTALMGAVHAGKLDQWLTAKRPATRKPAQPKARRAA